MGKQIIHKSGGSVSVLLKILVVKEDDTFVAYCPSLELSSYGETQEEAKIAFDEALCIFIEDTVQKGTFERELLNLGWQLQRKPVPLYQVVYTPSSVNKVIPNTQKVYEERVFFPINY